MWIEVFKSGEHKDSSGKLRKFTDDMLDKMVSLYNGKVSESTSFEAPLVKGHPKTDDPAYGWISKLKRKGSTLLAKLKNVSSEIIEDVKKGLFKKISIALYPDLMLRHVGMLGATAPAVQGLKNVEFEEFIGERNGEKGEGILITNDQLLITNKEGVSEGLNDRKSEINEDSSFDELRMTEEVNFSEKIILLEEENKELKRKAEELEKGNRINEYREFVNSLIECETGAIITPAQGEELVDILVLVDNNVIEFADGEGKKEKGEGNLTERIKALFKEMKPKLSGSLFSDSFSGDKRKQTEDRKITNDFDLNMNVNPDRLELHKKALELQSRNNALTYEQAVLFAQSEV